MRYFARTQPMTSRYGKTLFSLVASLVLGAAVFEGQAAVPFSMNISGDYGFFFGSFIFSDYPYFVIHNESRYNITKFEMTIGNLDKNFDAVFASYVPHGSITLNSPDTNYVGG